MTGIRETRGTWQASSIRKRHASRPITRLRAYLDAADDMWDHLFTEPTVGLD